MELMELAIGIFTMFLDGSDYGKPRPFTLEGYLRDRESRNAEAAYGDEMWRFGWRG